MSTVLLHHPKTTHSRIKHLILHIVFRHASIRSLVCIGLPSATILSARVNLLLRMLKLTIDAAHSLENAEQLTFERLVRSFWVQIADQRSNILDLFLNLLNL